MNPGWQKIQYQVKRERMADDLWDMVRVPSPTRREGDMAELFAEKLKAAGAVVEIDRAIPDSPSVIGRLDGSGPGPTFQLAGHLDHIDKPHPEPERDDSTISARGVSDMKNGLAGILEVVRVLHDAGRDFPGRVLVTAYGLHEAPLGFGEALHGLIDRGIVGDAALVAEGASDAAVTAGCGMAIWGLELTRSGEVCHELHRDARDDELLRSALALTGRIEAHNRVLERPENRHPLLGTESTFVGQLHYGDFYNRVPRRCFLEGTWRWHPGHTLETAQQQLGRFIEETGAPNVSVSESWQPVGESFEMKAGEPVVKALQEAAAVVQGQSLPLKGTRSINDAARLFGWGSVPTVSWSFDSGTAHADVEVVRLAQLESSCRVALITLLTYLDRAARS